MNEAILTIQGVADYLQIDEKTVYRMAQARELPGFKVRRQWRFKRVDIEEWIESRKKSSSAVPGEGSAGRAPAKARRVSASHRRTLSANRGR